MCLSMYRTTRRTLAPCERPSADWQDGFNREGSVVTAQIDGARNALFLAEAGPADIIRRRAVLTPRA